MTFPVSGVHCSFWLPPAVAFVIALVTAPAGISGAFLLLPFQMSVLGFVTPAVTPTNLVYNTLAIPGGVYRYAREKRLAWPLARVVVAGTLPGVCLGALIRIRYLPEPRRWKIFVGLVLLSLAIPLLRANRRSTVEGHRGRGTLFELRGEEFAFQPAPLAIAALLIGVAGGIYGVGGGAMIAPFAMSVLRLPARAVAGAALFATLLTSLAGALFFEILGRLRLVGFPVQPDWGLGLLFGVGGLCGSYCGARLQKHLPERWIRRSLGLMLGAVSLSYLGTPLAAQCIPENPGGSRWNSNRPPDADVPAARFSPLADINRSLPQWLCFNAGYRSRAEGYNAGNFQPGNSDYYLLTRFRLGVAVRPAHWMKIYAELQDATAFWKSPPLAPPYQSTWDLRRAFVDIGDPDQSPISLRVGRQDIAFGHLRLVGTAYWRNASRGWDAAMVTFNGNRVRVNVWAASPVIPFDNGLSHHQQGNNLYGVYSSFKEVIRGAVIEPYVLWRLTPGFKGETGVPAKLNEKTIGVHWAGPASRFDYDTEVVAQTGWLGADRIRAWAFSAILGYTVPGSRRKPRVFIKYDFASGDRNPFDSRRGTFDQLYPNIHDHHGLADQVAWQNLNSVRAGLRVSIRCNWMWAAAYNDWWLASATDAFYNASGAMVARDPSGMSGTHIGREYDAQTSYRYNRHLEFGAGIGYIRSGNFLVRTNHAHSYLYPYLLLNYNVL